MRILFLSTWFPFPPDNGSKMRAYHLLDALQRDHQVALIAFQPSGGCEAAAFASTKDEGRQIYAVQVDPYRYVGLPPFLKFASPIPVAFWPSRLMQRTVKDLAEAADWDVVVAFQAPVAGYALLLPNVPRVLDVDTALSHQLHERYASESRHLHRFRAWVSWQKARRFEGHMFRQYQGCTVVAHSELGNLRSLVKNGDCRVEVCPNGVDCRRNRRGLAKPVPNSLIYNGALTYNANYDAMAYFRERIYPLVKQQEPGTALTITGSTSGVDLSCLPMDRSVRWSGYVDDVRPLVAGAWACVVPIRQGGGTRLKILEAMALGTPVVSTTKGAEGLDVTPGKNILIADKPADFASQVVRLMGDPDLRERLAVNGRRLVEERYDWRAIGQNFVRLVESVVEQRSLR